MNVEAAKLSSSRALAIMLIYTGLVLALDTLAAMRVDFGFDFANLRQKSRLSFDYFKFFAWFVVPLVLFYRYLDWGLLSIKRLRKFDVLLFLAAFIITGIAVSLIPFFDSLSSYYTSGISSERAVRLGIWTLSWVIGWEFLHRFLLLFAVARVWPRYGWLIVPFFEFTYHLQKPLLEALAVLVYSVVLCQWALRRKSILLPCLTHLFVEIQLIVFLSQ